MKEYPVYKGLSRQYSYGLGSIFKSAMRTVIPILKAIAKAGLKSVKEQGLEAIKDIASGQNVKQVLKRRGTSAAKSTLNRLVQKKPIKRLGRRKIIVISNFLPTCSTTTTKGNHNAERVL